MPHLALYTFGMLVEPWGHPAVAGFQQRLQPIFDLSWKSPGFIDGHRNSDVDPRYMPWGVPTLVTERNLNRIALTLSRWESLESAFAFSYGSLHAEALRHRKEWATPTGWPPYCLWWIPEDRQLSYREGAERLTRLHEHGSTAESFSFRGPFDLQGNRTSLDRVEVAQLRTTVID